LEKGDRNKMNDFNKPADILILSIGESNLHFYEFVRPISQFLHYNKIRHFVRNYKDLPKLDLSKVKKIIIAGTTLKNNKFIKNIDKFERLKDFNGPILGICGGMQVLSLLYGGKLKKKQEIGFFKEKFNKDFLGMKGKKEVYHLHNNYATLPKDFNKYTASKITQAIKHKEKPIYGVLFHPEVRNKELIENFVNASFSK